MINGLADTASFIPMLVLTYKFVGVHHCFQVESETKKVERITVGSPPVTTERCAVGDANNAK